MHPGRAGTGGRVISQTIAILHYASPPTVGGVESTIAYQARGLSELGYRVRVVSGSGESFAPEVETVIDPLFGSKDAEVLRVKTALDQGVLPAEFEPLVERQTAALRRALDDCAVCIAHNVPSLNKNLALTAALARVHAALGFRLLAWCHDLAWTNPQYQPELHPGYPWELLRQVWPGATYVTVSEARRGELAALLNLPPEQIAVVVPGVDPARFLHWTPEMRMLVERFRLLDADGLLLVPARLTRRKNIALALRVLAEVRARAARDFRLIVTGPPGPHNPANPGYLGELLDLRKALGLEASAHFIYEQGIVPDDATMANLYLSADALFFPTLQEGFGIPVLEAGLAGIPVFCADIPPLRGTGRDDVFYFDPLHDSPAEIALRLLAALDSSPTFRLRVRVRQSYRWDALIRQQIVPLLA